MFKNDQTLMGVNRVQQQNNELSIPGDLKATFLRLIIVVYVDRSPRRIIEKPDLVRKLIPADGADYVNPVPVNKHKEIGDHMEDEDDEILDQKKLMIDIDTAAKKKNSQTISNANLNEVNNPQIELDEDSPAIEQNLEDKETI